MRRYYYDLHIHSCLSPCGDEDNTPNNILGMASISEIDIVALTDHNTCKNCPAFFEAAKKYGIPAKLALSLPGLYTTSSSATLLKHAISKYAPLQNEIREGKSWIFQIII